MPIWQLWTGCSYSAVEETSLKTVNGLVLLTLQPFLIWERTLFEKQNCLSDLCPHRYYAPTYRYPLQQSQTVAFCLRQSLLLLNDNQTSTIWLLLRTLGGNMWVTFLFFWSCFFFLNITSDLIPHWRKSKILRQNYRQVSSKVKYLESNNFQKLSSVMLSGILADPAHQKFSKLSQIWILLPKLIDFLIVCGNKNKYHASLICF